MHILYFLSAIDRHPRLLPGPDYQEQNDGGIKERHLRLSFNRCYTNCGKRIYLDMCKGQETATGLLQLFGKKQGA